MANMMDYLEWRGDLSLDAAPFNEIDNLLFTQVIYLDWMGIVPGIDQSSKVTVEEAKDCYLERYPLEEIQKMPRLKQSASQLLLKMAESERFAHCYLSNYVEDINEEEESQFSAMKVDLDDGSVFISFSGTDHTLAGWKENFNMSYLAETPGQLKAVKYVEDTVPFYKNRLRFGGHSKGGNLAVYAAMHCRKSIQRRLLAIYNNDGPGFTQKMISEEGYQRILDRIHTYLPQSSVVGMLLEHEEEIEVIQSTNNGIMQHDAFSWEVKGTSFVHLDELETNSIYLDRTLKNWVNGLNELQRQQFVDALFTILENANIDDTDKLGRMSFTQFVELMKAVDGLSPESKEVLKDTIWRLLNSARDIMANRRKMQKLESSEE